MSADDSFEAFAKRIRASAESIPLVKAGRQTTLAALSKSDQNAYIDRCWADGLDPLGDPPVPETPKLTVAEKRAAMNAYPVAPGAEVETFLGWVQRALVPGPGYEWATVVIPRHTVESCAVPDKIGRSIRRDTREVMTNDIIGRLANWELGNRVRKTGT